MEKSFTFSADSFHLRPDVESFLRTKKAIYMDFGSSAYIKSDSIPSIMSELLLTTNVESSQMETAELLKTELGKLSREKTALEAKLSLIEPEMYSLRTKILGTTKDLEVAKAENLRLSQKNASAFNQFSEANDNGLKKSHEKLQKEVQQLRGQSIEAIASLKVLEEENEELRKELDNLRPQRTPLEKRQG